MLAHHDDFLKSLRSCGLDERLSQNIKQIAPHDAHQTGGPVNPNDDDRNPEVGKQVTQLAPSPRRAFIVSRK